MFVVGRTLVIKETLMELMFAVVNIIAIKETLTELIALAGESVRNKYKLQSYQSLCLIDGEVLLNPPLC
jgi:hypothetical protein